MAEIAIIAPALATFFAGLNAVMKVVSVFLQYRANRRGGGDRPDYLRIMSTPYGDNLRARPQQHLLQAPTIANGSGSPLRRFSQVAGPALSVRNSTLQLAYNNAPADSFGGLILLTPVQQARNTHMDTSNYGVSTGTRPRGLSYSSESMAVVSAKAHWKSLKSSDYGVSTASAKAVAVVDYTHSNVTMFVEKHKTYYRSYKVKSCPDIAGFVLKFQRHEVFSGEIVNGKLARCNHAITRVDDDGESAFQSTNCWTKLGISAAGIESEVARAPIFVQMVRGAVFGLLCCAHKKPSSMNVDMRYGNGVDFVHVDTDVGGKLERGPDCCFSVFSICTNGWLRQKVLVG